ncbi:hypothetical protein [Heterosigma akashiwo virus 01]|jgi:hypothetical protein|uniref:Uncharacterized protein n=1 Tax=Heterosigma akashiwo virus 01 TaxID=97195 RepID=A0A1C9C4X6_HAV01|nr:hypothetical protein D1R72_gp007 [Heterosigma akashiwo virus 01]AOM63338.1 hypothetical protein [Heterosigma akashiwo virus 01]
MSREISIQGNNVILSHSEYIELRNSIKTDIVELHAAILRQEFNEQNKIISKELEHHTERIEKIKDEVTKVSIRVAEIKGRYMCICDCVSKTCDVVSSKCVIS